jgi:outer membrane immunogenic protein
MRSFSFSIAGLAVLLASTSAFSADLAVAPVEPVAPVVTAYDWSGPYIGLHAGWGWGREDDDQSRLFPNVILTDALGDHFDMDGFIGGVHAGYNYQINQFVLGVEGDIDYSSIKGDVRASYLGGDFIRNDELKTDWQGSARLRAGYAIDNFLIYATGGVAFANAKFKVNGFDDSNTHIGWTVGLGAEYAFTQNWIGRAEVRYTDFSKKTYQTSDGPVKAGWNQTTATVGISYKF